MFAASGLTRLQATVYLTLLEVGEKDLAEISLLAGLSRLVVAVVLCELEELGLVKEII